MDNSDKGSAPKSQRSQELAFINSTSVDRRNDPATQSLVRRHVMRDIGRARRKHEGRSRRKKAAVFPLALIADGPDQSLEVLRRSSATDALGNGVPDIMCHVAIRNRSIPRPLNASAVDPFQHFPVPMDRRNHELIATGMSFDSLYLMLITCNWAGSL